MGYYSLVQDAVQSSIYGAGSLSWASLQNDSVDIPVCGCSNHVALPSFQFRYKLEAHAVWINCVTIRHTSVLTVNDIPVSVHAYNCRIVPIAASFKDCRKSRSNLNTNYIGTGVRLTLLVYLAVWHFLPRDSVASDWLYTMTRMYRKCTDKTMRVWGHDLRRNVSSVSYWYYFNIYGMCWMSFIGNVSLLANSKRWHCHLSINPRGHAYLETFDGGQVLTAWVTLMETWTPCIYSDFSYSIAK